MNPKIEALPKYKNYPIPFFATMTKDGIPDFKVYNARNRELCLRDRLCWVCGTKLGYWIVFIGGPGSCNQRLFVDGPMHEDCARDAMVICPFMLGTTDYAPDSSFREDRFDNIRIRPLTNVQQQASSLLGLYKTRGFRGVRIDADTWLFQPYTAYTVEYFQRIK